MAINKNHEFEDLNGTKCAIVEKNAHPPRVEFLKHLLAFNGYDVVVTPSPPPKAAPAPKPAPTAEDQSSTPATVEAPAPPPPPETFTVGVTDVTFNPTNAVFGRLLRTEDGHVVTLAYWQQNDAVANDEVPYFESPSSWT